MTDRLQGKVALISGGARGMGGAEARLFVAEGAQVVIGDVLVDEGKALAGELGDAARFVELDVTEESSWQAAVAAATSEFGHLDVLINNAGIWKIMPIAMMSAEDYMEVVKVNQLGVFLGMKAAIPAMSVGGGSMVTSPRSRAWRAPSPRSPMAPPSGRCGG
jgi:3alpha(or 20beta)-hydroxysteroid dehydrogenase